MTLRKSKMLHLGLFLISWLWAVILFWVPGLADEQKQRCLFEFIQSLKLFPLEINKLETTTVSVVEKGSVNLVLSSFQGVLDWWVLVLLVQKHFGRNTHIIFLVDNGNLPWPLNIIIDTVPLLSNKTILNRYRVGKKLDSITTKDRTTVIVHFPDQTSELKTEYVHEMLASNKVRRVYKTLLFYPEVITKGFRNSLSGFFFKELPTTCIYTIKDVSTLLSPTNTYEKTKEQISLVWKMDQEAKEDVVDKFYEFLHANRLYRKVVVENVNSNHQDSVLTTLLLVLVVIAALFFPCSV